MERENRLGIEFDDPTLTTSVHVSLVFVMVIGLCEHIVPIITPQADFSECFPSMLVGMHRACSNIWLKVVSECDDQPERGLWKTQDSQQKHVAGFLE